MQIKNKFNNKKKKIYDALDEKAEILLESNKSSNSGFNTDEEQKSKTS